MPRVVDHEARRAEIISAVLALVAEEGAEGVTVRRAAAAAGLSTGALAHYFADKDELLAAAFVEVARRVGRRVAAVSAERDPADLLHHAITAVLPLDAERRAEARAWLAFLDRALVRQEVAALQREVYARWRRQYAEILRAGRRAGVFRADLDCEATAAWLIAVADGLTLQLVFDPAALAADAVEKLIASHIDALRPR
ncbi:MULTISPECIES: TetR/AcrR family transcriptional regulator [Thermomonospora]|uniref:Transcriptional regulator, TetR family n=1 Tax=Thermomonospora curvata (strain ATCC 19995 / DSM 43183 / JCM 3096 / KCTC 9072 / NBRC 15933 / NCIMB 10081 / Henssen B9) TaxID=471852 RepID=D1A3T2_THECD|nr:MULTISPECIES: TetR/AcrR family transcriptional regulator [Thermomonospora]ACY97985.1 transcriptional regulator, TetR family [Thermomonospora curvata DSM 43183]PKK14263.1 MAG: TetR family transcriptional regulator [Thermomonospora sp. CIF 1]